MTLKDLPDVLSIESQSHSHPWSEKSFLSSLSSTHHCFLLESDKHIIAYVIASTAADEAELLNITVDKVYRRLGLASVMLDALFTFFDSSIETLFLEVRESNAPAISLYENLGFNAVGHRPNYYPSKKNRRENAIIMAKMLQI